MLTGDESSARYALRRVARHAYWVRTQGLSRLVEEDQLNPVTRAERALAKWRWRRRHGRPPGSAMPVYVVGLQRSGTNMLTRGFEAAPEFEVHNENDRRVFDRFQLRSDQDVAKVIAASRHRFVLFKPLCDSHRVDRLLDDIPGGAHGSAIWVYR